MIQVFYRTLQHLLVLLLAVAAGLIGCILLLDVLPGTSLHSLVLAGVLLLNLWLAILLFQAGRSVLRRNYRARPWVLVMVLAGAALLFAAPALAQDTGGGDIPADVIMLPTSVVAGLGLLILLLTAGVLIFLDRVIRALKESNPPDVVDTITRGLGDGLERTIQLLKDAAPQTQTNIDDILLEITEPLTKAVIDRLHGDGLVVQAGRSMPPVDDGGVG